MTDIFVGSVAVGVVPDARGWEQKLRDQILPDSKKVGDEVGTEMGKGISEKVGDSGDDAAKKFSDEFKLKLKKALENLPKPKIDGDSSAIDRKIDVLRGKLEELGHTDIIDTKQAIEGIALVEADLKGLQHLAKDTKLGFNTKDALRQIAELRLEAAVGLGGAGGGGKGGKLSAAESLFGTAAGGVSAGTGVLGNIMNFFGGIKGFFGSGGAGNISTIAGAASSGASSAAMGISPMVAFIVPLIAAAAPFIGSLVGGAIVSVLGSGLLAMGIGGAFMSGKLTGWMKNLGKQFSTFMTTIGGPFIGSLGKIFATIGKVIGPNSPFLIAMTTAGIIIAKSFTPFVEAIVKSFGSPAVSAAIMNVATAFGKILDAITPTIGPNMDLLANSVSDLATVIANNPSAVVNFMNAMVTVVNGIIRMAADLARVYNWLHPTGVPAGSPPGTVPNNPLQTPIAYRAPNLPSASPVQQPTPVSNWIGVQASNLWNTLQQQLGISVPKPSTRPTTAASIVAPTGRPGAPSFTAQATTLTPSIKPQVKPPAPGGWISFGHVIEHAWDVTTSHMHAAWSNTLNRMHSAWSTTINYFVTAGHTFEHGWDVVVSHIHAAWSSTTNYIHSAWSSTVNYMVSVGHTIEHLWDEVTSHVHAAWSGTMNFLHSTWSSAINWFSGIGNTIKGYFTGAIHWLEGAGNDIINGLLNGMSSIVTNAGNWIKTNIVDKITGFLTGSQWGFSIRSPARKMIPIGKQIITGIVQGMLDEGGKIGKFVGKVFGGWPGAIMSFLSHGLNPLKLAPKFYKIFLDQVIGGGAPGAAASFVASKAAGAIKAAWGWLAGGGSSGGVARWAGVVSKALTMLGLPQALSGLVLRQMQSESGGDPRAINLTDTNARAGDPSRGLMQVIGTTFSRWHVKGTSTNIWDPLANIAAAINYAIHGRGIGTGKWQLGSGGPYDQGGWLPVGATMAYNFTGQPERILSPEELRAFQAGQSGPVYHAHFDGLTGQVIEGQVRTAFRTMSITQGALSRPGRRSLCLSHRHHLYSRT